MSKTPIKVAGTCPAGHALVRDADLDPSGRPRLTWRGQCPTQGCDAHLIARRVKPGQRTTTAVPATAVKPPATTTAPPPARRVVRKVTAYREPANRPPPKRRPGATDSKPADVSATAPVPAIAKGKPPEPEQPSPGPGSEPKPTGRRRLSFGGPDARDKDGWTIPGIY